MPVSLTDRRADRLRAGFCFEADRLNPQAAIYYPSHSNQPALQIYSETDPQRALLQQFIHHCFARRYAADIHEFMPYLIAWQQSRITHAGDGFQRRTGIVAADACRTTR